MFTTSKAVEYYAWKMYANDLLDLFKVLLICPLPEALQAASSRSIFSILFISFMYFQHEFVNRILSYAEIISILLFIFYSSFSHKAHYLNIISIKLCLQSSFLSLVFSWGACLPPFTFTLFYFLFRIPPSLSDII